MRLSGGGENQFETAYNKYADMMYRIALSHMNRRDDAEDVVHDAFIKYVQSSPAFSDDDHERAWLIRVTVNRCRDLLRRRSIRAYVNLDEIGEIPDEEAQYEGSGIIASVSALPDKYKSVIILHYLEGYSVEKTASILGLSESAVKMRLSRGREMLKKTIEKEGAQ